MCAHHQLSWTAPTCNSVWGMSCKDVYLADICPRKCQLTCGIENLYCLFFWRFMNHGWKKLRIWEAPPTQGYLFLLRAILALEENVLLLYRNIKRSGKCTLFPSFKHIFQLCHEYMRWKYQKWTSEVLLGGFSSNVFLVMLCFTMFVKYVNKWYVICDIAWKMKAVLFLVLDTGIFMYYLYVKVNT